MKCAICGKEINGGFPVERECLEALKADRDKWAELSVIGAQNCQFDCEERKKLEKLQAENAELKARLEKAELCFKLAVDTMRYEFAGCSEIENAYELMEKDRDRRFNDFGNERAYNFFEKVAEARLKELEEIK